MSLIDMSFVYHEAMLRNGIGALTFEKIATLVLDKCRFFPKVYDLLEIRDQLNASQHEMYKVSSDVLQLEYQSAPLSPESVKMIGMIVGSALAHEITHLQSEELVLMVKEAHQIGADLGDVEKKLVSYVGQSLSVSEDEQKQAYEVFKNLSGWARKRIMELPEGERYEAIMKYNGGKSENKMEFSK